MEFMLHMLEASHHQCEVSSNPHEPSAAATVDTSGEAERLWVQAPGTFATQSERSYSPGVWMRLLWKSEFVSQMEPYGVWGLVNMGTTENWSKIWDENGGVGSRKRRLFKYYLQMSSTPPFLCLLNSILYSPVWLPLTIFWLPKCKAHLSTNLTLIHRTLVQY